MGQKEELAEALESLKLFLTGWGKTLNLNPGFVLNVLLP